MKVGELAKNWASAFLTIPRVHYAKRALRIYLLRFTDGYPDEFRADRAALMPDWERFEKMFAASRQNFEGLVNEYRSEFRWPLGRIYNGAFQTVDAELYHSMIRRHRPDLIIEIGCGHSSRFSLDALELNRSGRSICIDPNPYYHLPEGVAHLQSLVQDVNLTTFDDLGEDDILFIDSSHTTEEVQYHLDKILPRLRPGVLIQHHDFFFPFDIPWPDRAAQAEQNQLLEFYEANADSYEILISTSYLVFREPFLVRRLIDSYRWAPVILASSLWTRKIK